MLIFAAGGALAIAQAVPRKALIVANTAYRTVPRLDSSAASARSVGDALQSAGFSITVGADLNLAGISQTIDGFADSIKGGDSVVFAYLGYGLQVDGENYLAPVDFNPRSEQPIFQRAYSLSRAVEILEDRRAALKIFIVDAAPAGAFTALGATVEGLAPPGNLGSGTLFWFSAQPGRSNAGSWFGAELAAAISAQGSTLDEVFRQVQESVSKQSGGAQVPAVFQALVPAFYFHAPVTRIEAPAVPVAPKLNPIDRQEYVWINPGEFEMGCVPVDKDCEPDESPRHHVRITKGFWMGKTEVSVRSYQRYVEAAKTRMPPASSLINGGWKLTDRPIFNVTWDDASAYCKWVGGRLPTEAEWEYSARGGLANNVYPWGADISRDRANFDGTGQNDKWSETSPVQSFDPNPFGLYDMAGNVWEFTADWYDPAYYASSPDTDPTGPRDGKEHVTRGGSWNSAPKHLRSSIRSHLPVPNRGNAVGFRCVLPELR